MDPCPVATFILLSSFVRSRPIALGVRPEAGEGECKFRRWFGCGERFTKIVQGHVGYVLGRNPGCRPRQPFPNSLSILRLIRLAE